MEKLDLKKTLKTLYKPSGKKISVVDVPSLNFLMADGKGDPNSSTDFREAVSALFSVSFTLKFMVKKGETTLPAEDYAVMPLEALWWSDDMHNFQLGNKDGWQWTVMVLQPDFITAEMIDAARERAAKKKELPAAGLLRLEKYREGQSAQILYTGPYADEAPTIQEIHRFIDAQGGEKTGKHHEIYLNDPQRTAPEKLKTVIRQPFSS